MSGLVYLLLTLQTIEVCELHILLSILESENLINFVFSVAVPTQRPSLPLNVRILPILGTSGLREVVVSD